MHGGGSDAAASDASYDGGGDGGVDDCPGSPEAVVGISLPANNLTGDVGAVPWEALSATLTVLDLDKNGLTGSPAALTMLYRLEYLGLASNRLEGPLDVLVTGEDSSSADGNRSATAVLPRLVSLVLPANQLSGTLPARLLRNPALEFLDLAYNNLSGPLPVEVFAAPSQLRSVRLAGNRLAGSFPVLPQGTSLSAELSHLDVSMNRLEGGLPRYLGAFPQLAYLDASHNRLAGPVAPLLRTANSLAFLALRDNLLNGTLPSDMRAGNNLQFLDLSLNNLSGSFPSSFGLHTMGLVLADNPGLTGQLPTDLDNLKTLDIKNTRMQAAVPGAAGLPRYLELSNMCGRGVEGSTELWEWDTLAKWHGYEVQTEGDAFLVAFHEPADAVGWCITSQLALLNAEWDPELFRHHKACIETVDSLQPAPTQPRLLAQIPSLGAPYRTVSPAGGVPSAHGWPASQPAIVPQQPQAPLTLTLPELAVVRRASSSFNTPDFLIGESMVRESGHHDSVGGIDSGVVLGGYSRGGEGRSSYDDRSRQARLSLGARPQPTCANSASSTRAPGSAAAAGWELTGADLECCTRQGVLYRGLRVRMGVATGSAEPLRSHAVTQRMEYYGEVRRRLQAVADLPHGGQVLVDANTFNAVNTHLTSMGQAPLWYRVYSKRSFERPKAALDVNGIMLTVTDTGSTAEALPLEFRRGGHSSGIASAPGPLPSRSSVDACTTATGGGGVAGDDGGATDAEGANGGLGGTAGASGGGHVSGPSPGERLSLVSSKLGPATAKRLLRSHPTPQMVHCGSMRARGGLASGGGEAGLLGGTDRGEGSFSEQDVTLPLRFLHETIPVGHLRQVPHSLSSAPSRRATAAIIVHREAGQRRASAAPAVGVMAMGMLVPGLEERARLSKPLNAARQLTPGYLDAPAASAAPLGHLRGASRLLPAVAVAFCSLERYPEMVAVSRDLSFDVLAVFNDVVRRSLLVCGGYECLEQEGHFMMAFAAPAEALEWCLMLQELIMEVSWTPPMLCLPGMQEQLHPLTGAVLFRGPRVKAGMYAGVPTRVGPHPTTGRADYHGPCVNRAARFCHAAAQGGQVIVARSLMEDILRNDLGLGLGDALPGTQPTSALLRCTTAPYDPGPTPASASGQEQGQGRGQPVQLVASVDNTDVPPARWRMPADAAARTGANEGSGEALSTSELEDGGEVMVVVEEPTQPSNPWQGFTVSPPARNSKLRRASTVLYESMPHSLPTLPDICIRRRTGAFRWLWAQELLIEDLGTFRFKGVAGVHQLVSISTAATSERRAGPRLHTAKGERVEAGKGPLYRVVLNVRAGNGGGVGHRSSVW
ncbi:hypothetical protein GPECTOR_14g25 [Gonium pectorale]|uniref:Guanylate cyclase domain-containing protein n=1 Tax=Gonium pectorale TaxID=33097 RepID=A0A150GMK6_GONPE|nr:hypothetical protein GPECTOR_14g25 [Gonium pectorale]|eukprot:KXZ51008.1 hypothetical protein GPECTOR_14g25 [Gonium pectorale]